MLSVMISPRIYNPQDDVSAWWMHGNWSWLLIDAWMDLAI